MRTAFWDGRMPQRLLLNCNNIANFLWPIWTTWCIEYACWYFDLSDPIQSIFSSSCGQIIRSQLNFSQSLHFTILSHISAQSLPSRLSPGPIISKLLARQTTKNAQSSFYGGISNSSREYVLINYLFFAEQKIMKRTACQNVSPTSLNPDSFVLLLSRCHVRDTIKYDFFHQLLY